MAPLTQILQAVRANAKLGWDQEGNWTHPLLYLIYALIAPIAGVLMLVFMYRVIFGHSADQSFLKFLLAGAAVFLYVRLLLQGAGFAVVEDREHYRILRYIYIAPAPFPAQILGRMAVKFFVATVGSLVTIGAGRLFLGIAFNPAGVNIAGLAGSFLLGVAGLTAISWTLASTMLLIDRMGWVWAEGLAGLMFLVSGVVIPLSVLPSWFSWVGMALPITYWAELWRLFLYGTESVRALPDLGRGEIWNWLTITTIAWTVAAIGWQFAADRLARKWGRIERETFY